MTSQRLSQQQISNCTQLPSESCSQKNLQAANEVVASTSPSTKAENLNLFGITGSSIEFFELLMFRRTTNIARVRSRILRYRLQKDRARWVRTTHFLSAGESNIETLRFRY